MIATLIYVWMLSTDDSIHLFIYGCSLLMIAIQLFMYGCSLLMIATLIYVWMLSIDDSYTYLCMDAIY